MENSREFIISNISSFNKANGYENIIEITPIGEIPTEASSTNGKEALEGKGVVYIKKNNNLQVTNFFNIRKKKEEYTIGLRTSTPESNFNILDGQEYLMKLYNFLSYLSCELSIYPITEVGDPVGKDQIERYFFEFNILIK